VDDPTVDPRFGRVGKQTCKDTGPITRRRMEIVEDELVARSLDFMERSVKAGKPFFLWHNSPACTSGRGSRPSGRQERYASMPRHDGARRRRSERLLKKLDDLGIADNTIVLFTTDNGAEIMSCPTGNTPFHGEKERRGKGHARARARPLAGVLAPAASATRSWRTKIGCPRCRGGWRPE